MFISHNINNCVFQLTTDLDSVITQREYVWGNRQNKEKDGIENLVYVSGIAIPKWDAQGKVEGWSRFHIVGNRKSS